MTLTINTITRPTACDHYHVNVTVAGVERNVIITKAEFQGEPDDAYDRILSRLRSYCKENSLSTFNAIKTNLEGKTFQL